MYIFGDEFAWVPLLRGELAGGKSTVFTMLAFANLPRVLVTFLYNYGRRSRNFTAKFWCPVVFDKNRTLGLFTCCTAVTVNRIVR